jgi:hypothetical protein
VRGRTRPDNAILPYPALKVKSDPLFLIRRREKVGARLVDL